MILIVGLGNPGEKYEQTRHNFGFMAVQKFLDDYESAKQNLLSNNEKVKSLVAQIDWQPKEGAAKKVLLALPQTYMNNSGMGVKLVADYYKIDPSDIWVIHDELDLPVGAMRIRFGGAAAGHHGVESIIDSLGTDKFWRFRLGIGQSHPHTGREVREGEHTEKISKQRLGNVEQYVLSPFSQEDHNKARELLKHASAAMQYALEKDLEAAMNRYNTK
jgi:PTH1 family peptidyl-tRNA hydrolase